MKKLVSRFSLKQIIMSDVLLSAPLALALILAAEPVAQRAGGPGVTFYFTVGIVMLVWCVDLAVLATNERWQQKFFNLMIVFDLTWSLSALVLMFWFIDSLRPLGWVLFAVSVLLPLDMAWMKRVVSSNPPHRPAFGN